MAERPQKILIVDDEPNMLHMLSAILKQDGFDPACTANPMEALDLAAGNDFDFILSDVRMPGMDGIQLLEKLRSRGIEVLVILMSAYGTVDLALEAIRKGAYDYISKPFKTDEVILTLRKAAEREKLRKEVVRLKRRLHRFETSPEIVAESALMKSVLQAGRQAARFESHVLLTGESGTGKELLAREIHKNSPRAKNSFLAVNCGALANDLLESELFGHAAGSFTGAVTHKIGIFEEADGGTLFLDEIGATHPLLQVKLLRALDSGEIRRVGENTVRKLSVRIIAATNEDLDAAIKRGSFRADLFYRLNVVHIHIPPLRDRKDDIMPLVEHFVALFNKKMALKIKTISREARECLMSGDWKGNVRELQNIIERAAIISQGEAITMDCLPHDIRSADQSRNPAVSHSEEDVDTRSLKRAVKDLEKKMIARALNRTGGNRSQSAALLEISYPSLLQKIKEYGIV